MKRIGILLFTLLLAVTLMLPCPASVISVSKTIRLCDTYEDFVRGVSQPGEWFLPEDYFYPFENFASLGKLSCAVQYKYGKSSAYRYKFRDANNIELWLDCRNFSVPQYYFFESHSTKHLGTTHYHAPGNTGSYTIINGAYYCYNSSGELYSIMFGDVEGTGVSFEINKSTLSTPLCDYPIHEEQTLMARLLNPQTAHDAVAELYDGIENGPVQVKYQYLIPAWVLPTAICGGAVLLAGAVAATAVIIRRKRKKIVCQDEEATPLE